MNVSIGGIAKTVEITSFDKLGDVKVCMLTTTADGSVGFEQLSDEVRETIYASFPVDNAKGSIASFEDGADNVPVRELNLDLVPYQNLNGYSNPWVGGAGKNLWSLGDITATQTNIPFSLPSGTYTFSLSPSVNTAAFAVRFYYDENDSIAVAVQSSNSFKATVTLTSDVVKINISATGGTATNVQLESGSSATSYEPYENICPIYPANGKNLLNNDIDTIKARNTVGTWSGNTYTIRGISFVYNDDGTVTANGTATADAQFHVPIDTTSLYGDYCFIGLYDVQSDTIANAYIWDSTAGARCKQWDGSTAVPNSIDGRLCQVKLVQNHTINMTLRVMNGMTVNNLVFKPMLCHKETIGNTYVPYDSIGQMRTGKNLLKTCDYYTASSPVTKNADGSLKVYGSVASNLSYAIGTIDLPAGTYTIGQGNGNTDIYFQVFDGLSVNMKGNTYNSDFSFTLTEQEVVMIKLFVRSGISHNRVVYPQVEIGETATSYEPYQSTQYFTDCTSAGSVYGGTLDVTTGVLTVDKKIVVFDGTNNGFAMASTTSAFYSDGHATDGVVGEVLSNQYPYGRVINGASGSVPYPYTVCVQALNGVRFAIYNPTYTTASDFNAYLNNNPLQIVYPLATPQTYQLTPTQVKTLLGYNNIWADSGTVEVQYRANIGLYIQKIIGSSEDDMIANQNIAANQYFFVGEELYYSTSAISAGQTIIVGTNCIKTTLADALNALNS